MRLVPLGFRRAVALRAMNCSRLRTRTCRYVLLAQNGFYRNCKRLANIFNPVRVLTYVVRFVRGLNLILAAKKSKLTFPRATNARSMIANIVRGWGPGRGCSVKTGSFFRRANKRRTAERPSTKMIPVKTVPPIPGDLSSLSIARKGQKIPCRSQAATLSPRRGLRLAPRGCRGVLRGVAPA